MRILFFIVALLMANLSFSQNREFAVKLSLLPLVDAFGFPTANVGLENRLTDNLSWYNEFGVKIADSFLEVSAPNLPKSYGFKGLTELRYYISKNYNIAGGNSFEGTYIGVNSYFSRVNYNGELVYTPNYANTTRLNRNDAISEVFRVHRNLFTSNILIGQQAVISDHFLIDVFLGMGVRIKERQYTGKKYNPAIDKLEDTVDYTMQITRNSVETTIGQTVNVNYIFGIRLGYRN
jgi:hypothetical protein